MHRLKSNGRHYLESSSVYAKEPVRGKADKREDAAGLGKYGENQDKGGLSSSSNRVQHTGHPATKPGHG